MREVFDGGLIDLIPELRVYAFGLCRSWCEADDLVQDALVRALRSRSQFEPGSNLRAWMFTILRNAFYSDAARRRRVVQDVDGILAAQLTTEAEQAWRMEYEEVLDAMRGLTLQARDALVLVLGSGLSYEEAAEVCDCPVGTMKSRVNRARERVAELVGERAHIPLPLPETPLRAVAGAWR